MVTWMGPVGLVRFRQSGEPSYSLRPMSEPTPSTYGGTQSAAARRATYLTAAVELRKMAFKVQSPEMRRDLMQLAVLYQELAEYSATQGQPRDDPHG